MRKLYSTVAPPVILPTESISVETMDSQDNLHTELKLCIEGYCNIGAVYDAVASESYALVDNKNKALFNAYSALMYEKLGVSMPQLKQVSTESLDGSNGIVVNSEIALEGWISSLWEKIKGLFEKIHQNVQEFFKRHFIRVGKTKKALENLKEVLKKTDKQLGGPDLSSYKGGLLKRYAGYNTVNVDSVKKSLGSLKTFANGITKVNAKAEVMAKTHMVDKDFFSKIKALRDQSSGATASKADVDSSTPGAAKALLTGRLGERSSKKEESQTLGEIARKADDQANTAETEVADASTDDMGSEDENLKKAQEQIKAFMDEVKSSLTPSLNTALISGKMIKNVVVNDEFDLEVEMDDKAEEAGGIVLGGKSDLTAIVEAALTNLVSLEKDANKYGEINDVIMKNLELVDKLIGEIDRIDPVKFGKYRKLINEQVRMRLQLMRKFFSSYSKVGKNILGLSLESAEGAVDYTVLSLKYFE